MTEKASYRKGFLGAEFLSEAHRISAEVNLRNNPLIEIMNDPLSTSMRIENVYISPLNDPATLKGHYPIGQIFKNNVSLVVVNREEDAYTRRMTQKPNVTPTTFKIFLTIPGFEVIGGLKFESAVDIERFIINGADRFIVLYGATATATGHADIVFTGGGMMVNRQMLSVFFVEKGT